MEKLSMCRICLIKDVRLHCLVNTHLQEIYEILSGHLLETNDSRPLHACYMCYARLGNCLRLRTACLHSEELFSHLLSCEVTPSQDMSILQTVPLILKNVDPVVHRELNIQPSPATDEQLNEDWVEDLRDNTIDQEISSQFIKKEDMKSENLSYKGDELDYSIQSTKAQASDNSCVGDGGQNSDISTSNHRISSVDLQDICAKTVKLVLQRKDLNCDQNDLQDNIKDKGICTQFIKQEDMKYENVSSEDEELDYSIQSVKVESDSVSDNSLEHGTPESYVSKCNQSISSVDQKAILSGKTVQIVLHRMDLNGFGKAATVTEHLKQTYVEQTFKSTNLNNSDNIEMLKSDICEEYKQILHTSSETHCSENSDSFKHIRRHTRERSFRCPTCDKCFSKISNLTIHIRVHTREKPYKCDTCRKGFTTKSILTRHIRIHTGEKPYKCDTCGKCFRQKFFLSKHVSTHTGEKPYKCDTCGKGFTIKCNLSQHTRTHTGEKPYKCDTCGKGFSQMTSLSRHIRIHTGEKPYKCDTCGKDFTFKCNLSIHIRIHTGEKPYKCDTCGKGFSQRNSLSGHIRIHTGEKTYKCDMCGKCFRERGSLSKHTLTHTGEKPYKCDTCGKCFTLKSHLSQHIRIHTGEKPYKCATCGKGFSRRFRLSIHSHTHC